MTLKKLKIKKITCGRWNIFEKIYRPTKEPKKVMSPMFCLIKDYEDTHFAINSPILIEAMEQQGLTRKRPGGYPGL